MKKSLIAGIDRKALLVWVIVFVSSAILASAYADEHDDAKIRGPIQEPVEIEWMGGSDLWFEILEDASRRSEQSGKCDCRPTEESTAVDEFNEKGFLTIDLDDLYRPIPEAELERIRKKYGLP